MPSIPPITRPPAAGNGDTIAAIATPSGRGGIGIVRLSGANAWRIAASLTQPSAPPNAAPHFEPWSAKLVEIYTADGEVIDQAVATAYRRPRSYTAEDMVEIACHGSPVVLHHVLERCLEAGARLAEPGEFTMRAFLNGRIDLAQAEAVRDLIEARTLFQAKVAAQQVEGSVARWIAPIKQQLTDLIAQLEAGIDFAEDDVSVMPSAEITARMDLILAPLLRSRAMFSAARIAHDGLTLALVGRPNVGKSSLFNRLVEQDRAIVTASPGTTRDLVAETVAIDGIPIRFVDTAGIREAFDEAESIGIRKSEQAAADADITLLVMDGACGFVAEDRALLARLSQLALGRKLLLVVNKTDLPMAVARDALAGEVAAVLATSAPEHRVAESTAYFVSAREGAGVPELRQAIVAAAAPALGGARESALLTSLRHQQAVAAAHESLLAARQAAQLNTPHEMLLLDLYSSLRSLDELTGATTNEDILGRIFSTFCIGK